MYNDNAPGYLDGGEVTKNKSVVYGANGDDISDMTPEEQEAYWKDVYGRLKESKNVAEVMRNALYLPEEKRGIVYKLFIDPLTRLDTFQGALDALLTYLPIGAIGIGRGVKGVKTGVNAAKAAKEARALAAIPHAIKGIDEAGNAVQLVSNAAGRPLMSAEKVIPKSTIAKDTWAAIKQGLATTFGLPTRKEVHAVLGGAAARGAHEALDFFTDYDIPRPEANRQNPQYPTAKDNVQTLDWGDDDDTSYVAPNQNALDWGD